MATYGRFHEWKTGSGTQKLEVSGHATPEDADARLIQLLKSDPFYTLPKWWHFWRERTPQWIRNAYKSPTPQPNDKENA